MVKRNLAWAPAERTNFSGRPSANRWSPDSPPAPGSPAACASPPTAGWRARCRLPPLRAAVLPRLLRWCWRRPRWRPARCCPSSPSWRRPDRSSPPPFLRLHLQPPRFVSAVVSAAQQAAAVSGAYGHVQTVEVLLYGLYTHTAMETTQQELSAGGSENQASTYLPVPQSHSQHGREHP